MLCLDFLQVELGPARVKFQSLQHFLFLLRKLLKEGNLAVSESGLKLLTDASVAKYSSQGGFLHQPLFEPLLPNAGSPSSDMDGHLQEKFSFNLSNAVWPSLQKVLVDGKTYIDCSSCQVLVLASDSVGTNVMKLVADSSLFVRQILMMFLDLIASVESWLNKFLNSYSFVPFQMTCVRVLELIPVIFEKHCPSTIVSGDYKKKAKGMLDLRWLQDLIDWGKSSLSVVLVYWRKTILSLLTVLKGAFGDISSSIVGAIEESVACGEDLLWKWLILCQR